VFVRFVDIGGIIDHHCLEMIVRFVDKPVPGLGQAQKCGRVKPVNGIPTLLF
jgi:hypothetical protein